MRTFAAALSLLVWSTAAPALADPCSHESFEVDGKALAVTVCAAPPSEGAVTVTQTFRSGSASFSAPATIDVLSGASVSRTSTDVALSPIGSSRTLHLTLAYRSGSVSVEHALLLPGAIPLK
ncbi:MAG TPA: hypothetical protein VMA36_00115 [Candidatus Limnocylindria bacterium]|jgi:hypothetical protein|nr:hypothetical protein [Candidatus Limnocylindria bacterium]